MPLMNVKLNKASFSAETNINKAIDDKANNKRSNNSLLNKDDKQTSTCSSLSCCFYSEEEDSSEKNDELFVKQRYREKYMNAKAINYYNKNLLFKLFNLWKIKFQIKSFKLVAKAIDNDPPKQNNNDSSEILSPLLNYNDFSFLLLSNSASASNSFFQEELELFELDALRGENDFKGKIKVENKVENEEVNEKDRYNKEEDKAREREIKNVKLELVIKHYHYILLRKVFNSWRSFCVEEKLIQIILLRKTFKALKHSTTRLSSSSIKEERNQRTERTKRKLKEEEEEKTTKGLSLEKLEKERRKEDMQIKIALITYHRKLLKISFTQWRDYIYYRRINLVLKARADRKYKEVLLRKGLNSFKEYLEHRRYMRLLKAKADHFYNIKLHLLISMNKITSTILSMQRFLQVPTLSINNNTYNTTYNNNKVNSQTTSNFIYFNLLLRSFSTWKKYAQLKKRKDELLAKAIQVRSFLLKRKFFIYWKSQLGFLPHFVLEEEEEREGYNSRKKIKKGKKITLLHHLYEHSTLGDENNNNSTNNSKDNKQRQVLTSSALTKTIKEHLRHLQELYSTRD
ncbi:hypothetical protein ABK040_013040 [Willaertia magna]